MTYYVKTPDQKYDETDPLDIVCQAESNSPITVERYEKYL